LNCAINEDLVEEWKKYLGETRQHVEVLVGALKKLGLNPDQETPGRNVVRFSGMALVETMEIALQAGTPEAAQIVAAECVVQAETKDHMNWQLLNAAGNALKGNDQEVVKDAVEQVEDEEDEHVYHSVGWARELHLEALGLPAQLPPVEETKHVKTEVEAARVRKDRKEKLEKSGARRAS
jgi:hypothetical protein